ncbi:hypothetical protein MA16_Dca027822 [Dendrobium catenatum]|uniref:Aminotransferase-like plant mobile domain-containing protein n=1 Tax=Dendrobium catenatum TaxID=906689 RepID=A0A2I0VDZ7_9ASPA|nr:hypothetical protein MA16_Dca027822 [Dendrobium catenatum]
MLQGRDTFHSFFTRFPLLPECSEDSVEFADPDRWVTSLRLQCGEYHPLESSIAQRGTPLSEETAEPVSTSGHTFPGLPGVHEDLFLVGFLATWLCTFVFPLRAGSVRCSILLAASQLAQGQRLALAPATLARIYRSLRTASEAASLELRDLTLPWQYLYGWIHLHVLGAFTCLECPPYFAERGFPTFSCLRLLLLLSQRGSASFSLPHTWLLTGFPWFTSRMWLVYRPGQLLLTRLTTGGGVLDSGGDRVYLLLSTSSAYAQGGCVTVRVTL